jgi:hypothetical protein
MSGSEGRNGVALAFERESIVLELTQLSPLKVMRPGTKESSKYRQILTSVRAVGLVEPPVVISDRDHPGLYFLLDGHLRVDALKDLGSRRSSVSLQRTTTPTPTTSASTAFPRSRSTA